MALSAELEKLLGLITDEKEREARRKELTELADGGLRQAEFSRKMNELSEKRKAEEAQHTKNLDWYGRATKEYKTLQEENKAAQERIAALESAATAAGGTAGAEGADPELQKQLATARKEAVEAQKRVDTLASTVGNFNKMVETGELMTSAKFNEEVNKRGDALGKAILDIMDLEKKHLKEFGTDLNREELLIEAQKRGGNLHDAYKSLTEKAREEKLRKDIEAEVDKKYQEKMKAGNVPYAQGGEPVIGPLQQRLQKKDTGIPDDVAADGSGRLAGLIADELRREGK